jgi:hypothetical protein
VICESCGCVFCLDDDIYPEDLNRRRYCSATCKKNAQRRRNPREKAEAPRRQEECQSPEKIKYDNMHRAISGVEFWNLVGLSKRGKGRTDWQKDLKRVYPCYGHWHATHNDDGRPSLRWYLDKDDEVGRREEEKKQKVKDKLARKRRAA